MLYYETQNNSTYMTIRWIILTCAQKLTTFSFILDLADDQVIDHTTRYHVADLDSWLPGLVKPFITSLRLYLSHAYIKPQAVVTSTT